MVKELVRQAAVVRELQKSVASERTDSPAEFGTALAGPSCRARCRRAVRRDDAMSTARWCFLVGIVTCLADHQPASSPSTLRPANLPGAANRLKRVHNMQYEKVLENCCTEVGGESMACDDFAREKSAKTKLAAGGSRSMQTLSSSGVGHRGLERRRPVTRSMSVQLLDREGAGPVLVPDASYQKLELLPMKEAGRVTGPLMQGEASAGCEDGASERDMHADLLVVDGSDKAVDGAHSDEAPVSASGGMRALEVGASAEAGEAEIYTASSEEIVLRRVSPNVTVNTDTTDDLVASVWQFCQAGNVEEALELVQADMRNALQPACADILLAFAEAGRSDCAQAALLHMQMLCVEVGGALDTATYNALMLAYARDAATASEEGLDQAMGVLDLMDKAAVDKDITTFNRLMEACSAAAGIVDPLEMGDKVLDIMRKEQVQPDVETFNTLLEACGKLGWSHDTGHGLDIGSKVVARMVEEEVKPTTDTFNILMYGCAWAAGAGDGWGGVERGLEFLGEMTERRVPPDVITFNNLIAACAQAAGASDGALALDQAFKLLWVMMELGLEPDQGTCDTLVATCAKTAAVGDSDGVVQGVQVLDMVYACELSPDPAMYKALLEQCVRAAQQRHAGAGCPEGWHGVQWTAHLLTLMEAFDSAASDAIAAIYAKLSALCHRRLHELLHAPAAAASVLSVKSEAAIGQMAREAAEVQAVVRSDASGKVPPSAEVAAEVRAGPARLPLPRVLWPHRKQAPFTTEVAAVPGPEDRFDHLRALVVEQLAGLRASAAAGGKEGGGDAGEGMAAGVEDGAGGTGCEVVEELWACAELGGTRAGQKTFLEKGQIPQYLEGERRLLDECACAGEGAEVYVNTMPIVPGIAALDTVESDTAASAAVQPVRADPRSVRIGLDAVQEQASSVSKECLDAAQAHTTLAQTQMGRAGGTPVLIDQYYGTCYYPHQGAADELLTMCTPWTEESHLGHRREESSDTRFVQQRGGCPGRLAGKQRVERRSVSDSSLVGAPHLEALSTSHTRRTGGRRGGQPSPPMTVAPSLGVIQTRALVTGKTTPKSPSEAVKCMGVQQVGAWLASSQVGLGECARCFVDAGVDGAGLLQLRELQARVVDVFYEAVQARVGVKKFGHVLRLGAVLSEL